MEGSSLKARLARMERSQAGTLLGGLNDLSKLTWQVDRCF